MPRSMIALMLMASLGGAAQAQAQDSVTATVRQGRLAGTSAGGIDSFKGIPFAAPPVGPLRWQPPVAPGPWQGTRDASHYGDACMQAPNPQLPMSEDCLTLNVWRPASARTVRHGAKPLPVMLWIHGGGSFAGSGRDPLYDGTALARHGVVVVSINYRLGALGYFVHPAIDAEGKTPRANYGLMDQRAAMQWVQANIARFGGDPKQVTIFGESAGGCYVNMWMTSPVAKGLFARAITHSCPEFIAGRSMAEGAERGLKLAHALGVEGTDANALAHLRALPAADFVTRAANKGTYPFVDGTIVSKDPFRAMAAGHVTSLPWLIGSNSFDASYLPYFGVDISKPLAAYKPADQSRILATYGTSQRAAMEFLSDMVMGAGDRLFARQAKGPTWLYSFRYEGSDAGKDSLGVAHGGELSYVFGNPGTQATLASPADRALSEKTQALWTDFAKGRLPLAQSWSAARATLVIGQNGTIAPTADYHRDRLNLAEPFARNAAGPWDP